MSVDSVKNKSDAVNPAEWVKRTSLPYHLTIRDIEQLELNKPTNIFLMDRNVYDTSLDEGNNPKNKAIKPSSFFRKGYYITFTKKEEGIKGKWIFNIEPNNSYNKEFDINLGTVWYPLKNDKVPERDWQGLFDLSKYYNMHYSDFPRDTKLGWRGPMMLVQNMDKCGYIIWTNDNVDHSIDYSGDLCRNH